MNGQVNMKKISKWQSQIDIVHREWCRENGYPVNWYRARHGRPKLNERKKEYELEQRASNEIKT